jgi:hypothetical protein
MAKATRKVTFFVWTAALGKILTIDNLQRRHILIVDWCCMCKSHGESTNHLLIHCSVTSNIWSFVLTLFGLAWVMPKFVLDLLECWQGWFQRHRAVKVWRAVALCAMWNKWYERNK